MQNKMLPIIGFEGYYVQEADRKKNDCIGRYGWCSLFFDYTLKPVA